MVMDVPLGDESHRRVRRPLYLVLGLSIAVALVLAVSVQNRRESSTASTPSSSVSGLPDVVVKQIAATSVRWGGPEHGEFQYARGPRSEVLQKLDLGLIKDDTDVYVVILSGKFVAATDRLPPGAEPPTGSQLEMTIVVDQSSVPADSGLILDVGVDDIVHDLSAIGPSGQGSF
jgi:hypothetical protein